MHRKRLQKILESYGADPAHWPPEEKRAAQDHLRAQPDAAEMVAAAQRVDDALASMGSLEDNPMPTASLRASVRRIPWQNPPGQWSEFLATWPQFSKLAAAVAIAGFLVGATSAWLTSQEVVIELGWALYGGASFEEIYL